MRGGSQMSRKKSSRNPFFKHKQCLSEEQDKDRRKHLSFIMLCLASALVFVPAVLILKHRIENTIHFDKQIEMTQHQETMTVALIYYRYMQGYQDYCGQKAYKLENYPSVFEKNFQNEKTILEQKAKKMGFYSLRSLQKHLKKHFDSIIWRHIKKDMIFYKELAQGENHKDASEYDVCAFLDTHASELIQNNENPDFQKIREFSQNH